MNLNQFHLIVAEESLLPLLHLTNSTIGHFINDIKWPRMTLIYCNVLKLRAFVIILLQVDKIEIWKNINVELFVARNRKYSFMASWFQSVRACYQTEYGGLLEMPQKVCGGYFQNQMGKWGISKTNAYAITCKISPQHTFLGHFK